MVNIKLFRMVLWIACGVAASVLIVSQFYNNERPEDTATGIGGSFAMTSAFGEKVTQNSFPDKAKLMFLGFTNCPDVCPTTLSEISSWMQALGEDADGLQPIFITADPDRDTSEILKKYVGYFDAGIVALRPTERELDEFKANYKVYSKKVPGEGGSYSVDHTASILLFRKDNSFFGTIDFHEERPVALAKLRRLLDS